MTALDLVAFLAAAPTAPPGAPPAMVDPTDIAALVTMALLTIRRIEIRGTDPRAFPTVPRADFDGWHQAALSAKNVAINACFIKFAASNVWFYTMRNRLPFRPLAVGGALCFVVWLGFMAYTFLLARAARKRATALGIVPGRRIVEEKVRRADVSASAAEEESSR
ncbi:MAG TPA: hypothetical protein VHE30_22610 [Polyangiaceae bacterium]|nr:hypothetical protein [Polyangiaceae bacterium]